MDTRLSEDQTMLQDSVRRFMEREQPFETRRARARSGATLDRAIWRGFGEMGWLGIGVDEAKGGYGGSAIEVALVAEALGGGQGLDPYLACGILPARLLASSGQAGAGVLASIVAGEAVVAVALSEAHSRGDISILATRALRTETGWRLNGHKTLVVGAGECDWLIVSAGMADDPSGTLRLFLVPKNTPGVTIDGGLLVDWTSGADVNLQDVEIPAGAELIEAEQAFPALRRAVDEILVALSAEAVGAMSGAIAITADYVKTRRQFGVPIASFQALQHRMADMAIELVQARSGVYRGLQGLTSGDPAMRSAMASGCKALVTRVGRWVTSQGIQLHGGYGITEEYRVGHYFKRLLVIDALFGRMDHHLDRYATWMTATSAEQDSVAAEVA